MKIYLSHGANPDDWFVVLPLPGETRTSIVNTPITSAMAIASLLDAGRTVLACETAGIFDVRKVTPKQEN